jgi:hypothetical protein
VGSSHSVWLDEDLPAQRPFRSQIQAELSAAKAALVIWSEAAAAPDGCFPRPTARARRTSWPSSSSMACACRCRSDQIQRADLTRWTGDSGHPGWCKVIAGIAEPVGGVAPARQSTPDRPYPPRRGCRTKPSIAVLPFANLSHDPEQEYFADGMVGEIVSALSGLKFLFVIGSGSTFAFKSRSVTPQDATCSKAAARSIWLSALSP